MKISNNGINLIKSFEGCILQSYDDYNDKLINSNDTVKGVLTIGWGTTRADLPSLYKGMRISQQEANRLFIQHLQKYVDEVNSLGRQWTQNQFDALVSFHYNTGSVKTLVANRNNEQIVATMKQYVHDGAGRTLAGLVRRRNAEVQLFLSNGVVVANNATTQKVNRHLMDLQGAINKGYNAHLVTDGIYGPCTDEAIKKVCLRVGTINDVVSWVQIRIGTKPDGIYGNATYNKVKQYQKDNFLYQDGVVGYNTLKHILKQYGVNI